MVHVCSLAVTRAWRLCTKLVAWERQHLETAAVVLGKQRFESRVVDILQPSGGGHVDDERGLGFEIGERREFAIERRGCVVY